MKPPTLDAIAVVLAELIGVALVMFFGCMGCLPFGETTNQLQTVLNFGFIIMTMIQVFGFISGAYLNPSVTIAAVIYKKLSIQMAGFYFIAQLIGGFIGMGMLKIVVPTHLFDGNKTTDAGFCMTIPHSDLSDMQALVIEFFATTVLVFINLAIWDHRNEKYQDSAPLKFGFAVFTLGSTAGPLTGASMNPARSFGPAYWSGNFKQHWIYWVAPLSSAVISTYVYRAMFWRKKDKAYISCKEHQLRVPLRQPATDECLSCSKTHCET
ncbi:aquaporin-like isoform X2 [Bradysia coprophila]|uniref:aquaporin-like isoform X2 n=1 Tax=Bradysia coprophila TaxID=38358 RepID=UPI00187D93A6|nr:aquaporin-like isoform X2 [Bradysia coprophila]